MVGVGGFPPRIMRVRRTTMIIAAIATRTVAKRYSLQGASETD